MTHIIHICECKECEAGCYLSVSLPVTTHEKKKPPSTVNQPFKTPPQKPVPLPSTLNVCLPLSGETVEGHFGLV